MARITSLTKRLAKATDRSVQLQLNLELRLIQQRLDDLNADKFGQKSERRGRSKRKRKRKQSKPKRGPNPQLKLPQKPQRFLLDEADRICPKCFPIQPLLPWEGKTVDAEEITLIEELYAVETKAAEEVEHIVDKKARIEALYVARRRLPEAESSGIIKRLRSWLDHVEFIPTLSLDKAVQWVNNGWVHLCRFLDDPRIPLDNNLMERTIRGSVLGRKTHAGSRSTEGTRVAAMFYSYVESCALQAVDARAYLIEATRRALEDRESVFLPEDYAAMLSARQSTAEGATE